jgi:hypothetical protein
MVGPMVELSAVPSVVMRAGLSVAPTAVSWVVL